MVVRDDPVLLQERHEVGEAAGLVTAAAAPDADDRGVVGMRSLRIRGDGLVVAERAAFPAGPVGRGHPAVVTLHDRPVRAVVGGQLDGRAACHPLLKLQDVTHRRAPEAVEALILIAHHAQVPVRSRQLQKKLLLDVVGVLVLVHQQVARAGGHGIRSRGVVEHVVHEPLKMGEVHPVGVQQCLLVALASGADGSKERIAASHQPAGVDELFRDLVEVAARALDGCPARPPAVEEQAIVRRSYDLVKVLEEEEELRQIVQRFVAGPERRPVPVTGEHLVAEAVNGRDRQLGEVSRITHLAGRCSQPVAHLEGGLPGEGAEHDLPWPGPFQQQEVQGPQDDAERLAGPRSRDHQQRTVKMADDRTLAPGKFRVVLQDGGRDAHSSPAFLKLKVCSGDTIRWSTTRRPMVSAASTMARVSTLSCPLGSTSPLGWLCASTSAAA